MIRMTRQRWLVLGVVIIAIIAHLSGASSYLTFESLKKHRRSLHTLVQNHPFEAPIFFVLLYTVLVSFALPGATVLTLAAGILFTQPWSTIVSVVGAATGACCNYYLSTCAFRSGDDEKVRKKMGLDAAQNKGGKRFANGVGMFYGLVSWEKVAEGIRENESVYMLLLRLVPIFPFWLVNIAPSVLGVRFFTFAWTTYVGIIPGSYVYTQCGYGLSSMMDEDLQDETLFTFLLKGIFNKHTAGGLVVLFLWLCFLLTLRWWVSKRTREAKQRILEAEKAEKKQKKLEKKKAKAKRNAMAEDEGIPLKMEDKLLKGTQEESDLDEDDGDDDDDDESAEGEENETRCDTKELSVEAKERHD